MAITVLAGNIALNYLLTGAVPSPLVTEWWVALFNGDDEIDGTSYARVAVTFLEALNGVSRNSAELTFGAGDEDWGAVTGWGIYSAETDGDLLITGTLAPFTPDGVEEIIVGAGEIEVSLTE